MPGNMPGRVQKKFLPGCRLFLASPCTDSSSGPVLCLALADVKQVKKIRQRFRVVAAGAAADDDRVCLMYAPLPDSGIPAQIQDLQNICITHFVLQGNAEKVKIFHRILGFQGKQRDMVVSRMKSVHDPATENIPAHTRYPPAG